MKFYKLNKKELENELNTDFENGLSSDEVERRSKECSNNYFSFDFFIGKIKLSLSKAVIFFVLAAFVYVFSAVFFKDFSQIYFLLAMITVGLLGFVGFNFVLWIINKEIESDSKKNIYKKLEVIRDGKSIFLNSHEILYGDIILLKKGDYIPVDAIVLESEAFYVDESDVTAERIVEKSAGVILDDNAPASELYNSVFCGSFVLSGSAKVVVTDVGSRVLMRKIRKIKNNDKKFISKITDYIKILLLILVVCFSLTTVCISVITKDFITPIVIILLLVSLLLVDYFSKYTLLTFYKVFLNLSSNKTFLKNPFVIQKINNSDLILWNQDIIFDGSTTLISFSDCEKCYPISEIGKNNIELFIYSALCSFNTYSLSFKQSILRVLRKINLDYNDIEKLCPCISEFYDGTSFEMCGRRYDKNNLIIAKGDVSRILNICSLEKDDVSKEVLNSLSENSTDIIAVAIKKVDIIPADLSEENDGFELLGFISVKKEISNAAISKISHLFNCGFINLISYSGNAISAKKLSDKLKIPCVSYSDFISDPAINLKQNLLVYDYVSNDNEIVDKLSSSGFKTIVFDKKSSKNIYSFNTHDSDAFSIKNCELVGKLDFQSVFEVLQKVNCAYSFISNLFVKILTVLSVYILCGIPYAFLKKEFIFNSVLFSYITILGIGMLSVFSLFYEHVSFTRKTKKFSSKPINIYDFIGVIIIVAFSLSMILVCSPFLNGNILTGMVAILLLSYLPDIYFNCNRKILWKSVFGMIPAALISVVFLTPISVVFGVEGFSFIYILLSLALGVGARLLTTILEKYLRKR